MRQYNRAVGQVLCHFHGCLDCTDCGWCCTMMWLSIHHFLIHHID